MAKPVTVMIVPDDGKQVRQLKLSRGRMLSLLTVCLLLAGSFVWLFNAYLTTEFDQAELQRLRVENGFQRESLQRMTTDLDDMRQELVLVFESEARLRQIADLDALPEAIPVAMGGIPELDNSVASDEIQLQINLLQQTISAQRERQETVRNLLNDQVSLSRATPAGWPAKGWLTSYFGKRKSPFTNQLSMHEGLDVAASIGTPVEATADGVVVSAGYSAGFGKMVKIDHGYGYQTVYGHNSKTLVKVGQRVKRGEIIARVGNTGRSTGPHLHYEVHLNGVAIDPRKTL